MNLLPEQFARSVERREIARIIGVGAFLATLAAITGLIALLPSLFILSHTQLSPGALVASQAIDSTAIVRSQALLKELTPVLLATSSPSTLIAETLVLRPKGVTIGHISYAGGKTGALILVGKSDTRDAIHAYQTALKNTGRFVQVSLPVDVLVGTLGGDFTMTLTGDF